MKRNYRVLTKLIETFSVRDVGKVPRESDMRVDSAGRTGVGEASLCGDPAEGAGRFQDREGRREHTVPRQGCRAAAAPERKGCH